MAWGTYIEQQKSTQSMVASYGTAEVLGAIVLILIIVIGLIIANKLWRKYLTKHEKEFKQLAGRKSWRLTQAIYWTTGLAYILFSLGKESSWVVATLLTRSLLVCVLFAVLREVYCYVQFGKARNSDKISK